MGSSCPLLSSPTGNDPAFPKLTLIAHSHTGGLGASFGSAIAESLLPEKLFTCQGTPCRRGQTVTGSGTGRAFRLGSPSIYNGHFFSKTWYCQRKISENLSTLLSESASGFVPIFFSFTLQRTKICRLLSMAVKKVFCAGCGRYHQQHSTRVFFFLLTLTTISKALLASSAKND